VTGVAVTPNGGHRAIDPPQGHQLLLHAFIMSVL
jgi:hypothetical protein